MQITKEYATLLGIGAVATAIVAIVVLLGWCWKVGKSVYTIAERVDLVPGIKADLDIVKAQQETQAGQIRELSDLVCMEGPERTYAIAARRRRHEQAEKGT